MRILVVEHGPKYIEQAKRALAEHELVIAKHRGTAEVLLEMEKFDFAIIGLNQFWFHEGELVFIQRAYGPRHGSALYYLACNKLGVNRCIVLNNHNTPMIPYAEFLELMIETQRKYGNDNPGRGFQTEEAFLPDIDFKTDRFKPVSTD